MTPMTLHTNMKSPTARWAVFRLPRLFLAPVGKTVIKTDRLSLKIGIEALKGGWDCGLLLVLSRLGLPFACLACLPRLRHEFALVLAFGSLVTPRGWGSLFPSALGRLLFRLLRLRHRNKKEGYLHTVLPLLDCVIDGCSLAWAYEVTADFFGDANPKLAVCTQDCVYSWGLKFDWWRSVQMLK